jgi:hypothetical protein
VTKDSDVPLTVEKGAQEPSYIPSELSAAFSYSAGVLAPNQKITFDASGSRVANGKIESYEWLFGDGTFAKGKVVHHAFPDAGGTLRDESGRFRVLLKITDDHGNIDWAYQPVVVSLASLPPVAARNPQPNLRYKYYEGTWNGVPQFDQMSDAAEGNAEGLDLSVRKRNDNYAIVYDGMLKVPADGGYTFTLLGTGAASLLIDSKTVAVSPVLQPNVCGDKGNAVQKTAGSVVLRAGLHHIRVVMTHTLGSQALSLKWQGPGIPLEDVPNGDLLHAEGD